MLQAAASGFARTRRVRSRWDLYGAVLLAWLIDLGCCLCFVCSSSGMKSILFEAVFIFAGLEFEYIILVNDLVQTKTTFFFFFFFLSARERNFNKTIGS